MPIEFRCHQCGKLLRVGDETAGKQAKCPSCGAVQMIPAASPAPEMPSPPPFAAPGGNPFGAGPPLPPPTPGAEPNPYQAPPSYPSHDLYGPPGAAGTAPIQRMPIDIGEVLTRTWEIYKNQMWMCIGVFLISLVINYAAQLVVQGVTMAMQAVQVPLAAIIIGNVVLVVLQIVFQTWIGVGQTMFFLKVARGETPSVGILFEGAPYLLRTILASLLIGLAMAAVVAICTIPAVAVYFATKEPAAGIAVFLAVYVFPAIYLGLTFFPYFYLIVDRDLGAIDSLFASREITQGNKLSMLGILLVGMLLYLGGLVACCVGALFTVPYVLLSMAVMYWAMSGGQAIAPFRR